MLRRERAAPVIAIGALGPMTGPTCPGGYDQMPTGNGA